jgi:hypothetical protein
VWWGIDLARTNGRNPGDGGHLAPPGIRMAWAAGVILPEIAFAVGMWLYCRHYVVQLEYDEQSKLFTVRHIRLPGSTKRVFRQEDIVSSRFHEGRLNARVQVNAPWWSIQIQGCRKPLILDAQGVVVEHKKMKKVLGR